LGQHPFSSCSLHSCFIRRSLGSGHWILAYQRQSDIDSSGRVVRIAGINWYGFETKDQVVHGLWARDYHTILNAIKNTGYNAIRLPYSNQMVESPIIPSNISYSMAAAQLIPI